MQPQVYNLLIPPFFTDAPTDCLAALDIGIHSLATVAGLGETPEGQLRAQCLEQLGVDGEQIAEDAFLSVGDALTVAWQWLVTEDATPAPPSLALALGCLASGMLYCGGDDEGALIWSAALGHLSAELDADDKLYAARKLTESLDAYWWEAYAVVAPVFLGTA